MVPSQFRPEIQTSTEIKFRPGDIEKTHPEQKGRPSSRVNLSERSRYQKKVDPFVLALANRTRACSNCLALT